MAQTPTTAAAVAITGAISAPRSVPATQPSSPPSSLASKYRGATVDDLQLSPAVCVGTDATVSAALATAHDHDYSQLPVMSSVGRKLQGYVDVDSVKRRLEQGTVLPNDTVQKVMARFAAAPKPASGGTSTESGRPAQSYTVIEPDTGLAELETFLQAHPFALVTDPSRAFVLGVATRQDLAKYVKRRGLGSLSFGGEDNDSAPAAGTAGEVGTSADVSMADAGDEDDQPKTGAGGANSGAAAKAGGGDASAAQGPGVAPISTARPPAPNSTAASAAAAQPDAATENAGAAGASNVQQTLLSRREEEERRKDRTLAEFLQMLDGYDPLIPDEVTSHYLERAGFDTGAGSGGGAGGGVGGGDDERLRRLLSLAAEKFVSDIATDAFQYARIRASAGPGKGRGGGKERARTVLTMDDLGAALSEYGINARRSDFYR